MIADAFKAPNTSSLDDIDLSVLTQTLAQRLAIPSQDWHRLKGNRSVRAKEQVAIALNYLINDQTEEALAHLQQATGWLDKSISAPPCPTHGK
ncbi:MAG: hypothetical protein F6K16_42085 [Symploca sp. SIO2B6]|nr:hypothetical protein [Symploca sp. SIO2B6]